ncbi:hypothetical protein BC940DRAFT_299956 [Gongronella butleri]|nr:hypothetical protein BC940DRAFT_299956 [Gongronella butleri]
MIVPQQTMSSRSSRVLEQLQETWQVLQKDLETTQAQLAVAREAKNKSETQSAEHVASNKECRAQIQELMKVLEGKERALDDTRQQSTIMEGKVKQLKEEAAAARKQMEALKAREKELERERDRAVSAKDLVDQQQKALCRAVDHIQDRAAIEHRAMIDELHRLRHIVQQKQQQYTWFAELLPENGQLEQKDDIVIDADLAAHVKGIQDEQRQVTQTLVNDIEAQVRALSSEIAAMDPTVNEQVQECHEQVTQLIQRIQSFAKLQQ